MILACLSGIGIMSNYIRLQRSQVGQCTIKAKQLHQGYAGTGMSPSYDIVETYRPDFQFLVQTADGHHSQAQGYDAFGEAFTDFSSEQAIIDRYTVGETYLCWYDPSNPTWAVLTRKFSSTMSFDLVLIVLILLFGGILVIGGISGMCYGIWLRLRR